MNKDNTCIHTYTGILWNPKNRNLVIYYMTWVKLEATVLGKVKQRNTKHACFHLYVKATKVNFIERKQWSQTKYVAQQTIIQDKEISTVISSNFIVNKSSQNKHFRGQTASSTNANEKPRYPHVKDETSPLPFPVQKSILNELRTFVSDLRS